MKKEKKEEEEEEEKKKKARSIGFRLAGVVMSGPKNSRWKRAASSLFGADDDRRTPDAPPVRRYSISASSSLSQHAPSSKVRRLEDDVQSENIMLADKHKIEKEQNAQLRNQLAQLVRLQQDQKLQIQQQDSAIQSLQAKIRSLEHQLNDALHSSETKGAKKHDALIETSSPLSKGTANMPSWTNSNIVGRTLDVVPLPLTAEKSAGSFALVRTSSEKVKRTPEGEYLTAVFNDFDPNSNSTETSF
ncbi:hypothetical protein NL676_007993 [Syzygium grande]|nr:hypothetical protein NL676_007993 [Syzygium grande]